MDPETKTDPGPEESRPEGFYWIVINAHLPEWQPARWHAEYSWWETLGSESSYEDWELAAIGPRFELPADLPPIPEPEPLPPVEPIWDKNPRSMAGMLGKAIDAHRERILKMFEGTLDVSAYRGVTRYRPLGSRDPSGLKIEDYVITYGKNDPPPPPEK